MARAALLSREVPAGGEAQRFVARQSDLRWAEPRRDGFATRGRLPRPQAKQGPPTRRGSASACAALRLLRRPPPAEAASDSPLEGWKPAVQTRRGLAVQVLALQE